MAASAKLFGVLAAAACVALNVHAAPGYPLRPVRMIVLFPPGGSDTVARMLGQKLAERLGQPFVIDNRPGAAGVIGADIVAKSPADGHTLLFATASFAIAAGFERKLPYDSVRDFSAIGFVAAVPFVLLAHPSVAVNSVPELLALAKARPDQLNAASAGTGGAGHLATELFRGMSGARITHIPYKGTGPALTALLAGEAQLMFASIGAGLPQARAGKVRALAVSCAARSSLAPELPTVAESGVPGYDVRPWYGILAPVGMPAALVMKWNREVARSIALPEMNERFIAQGIDLEASTPEAFASLIKAEVPRWRKIVKDSGARAD
jgi:tripartite-type tricarboxylate transporter receptor subunit TctC